MFRKLVTAALVSLALSTSALASEEWMTIGEEYHRIARDMRGWTDRCPQNMTRACAEEYKRYQQELADLDKHFPSSGKMTCKVIHVSYTSTYGQPSLPAHLRCDPGHASGVLLYVTLASYKCKGPSYQNTTAGISRLCNTEPIYVDDTITVEGTAVSVKMEHLDRKPIPQVQIGAWETNYVTKVTVKK